MNIDWNSSETHILFNPRQPLPNALHQLPKEGAFSAHIWLATSGSSSHPKWVALSNKAILCSAAAVNDHLESNHFDIWVQAIPSFHVGGLSIWARAHLSSAKVIDVLMDKRWDPLQFKEIILKNNATLSSLVPAQIYDLVSQHIQAPSTLRAIIVGGGALSSTIEKKARELGWPLLLSYGMTECASQIATQELSSPARLKLLSHIESKRSSEGKLLLRSPSLLTAYGIFSNSHFQIIDPKKEGWFESEDYVSVEDSYITPLGRSGDFIKIGGESVDVGALKAVMDKIRWDLCYPGDLVLLPLPHPRLGMAMHLVVTVQEKLEQLITLYHQTTMLFEKIRQVYIIDKIPRSPLGKVQLQELMFQISLASSSDFHYDTF